MARRKGFTPTGILHFAIGVSDLEEGRRFYEGVLGCTYLRQNDTTVFMKAGTQYFVLTNTKHHVPPNPPGDYEFHHAFIVRGEDFDDALRHLEAAGHPILVYEEEGHRTFTGRHAYVHDPFGNAIEIIDFHGIGDFSKPDFAGRRRRQAAKAAKPAKPTKVAKTPKGTARKAAKKAAGSGKKKKAPKRVPAVPPRRKPGRPARRPARPARRR